MKEDITVEFQEMRTNRNCRLLCQTIPQPASPEFYVIADKIIQWLAAPLPSSNHNNAMKKRQPGTGEWFTQSKDFVDWRIEINSFIWLHGIRES